MKRTGTAYQRARRGLVIACAAVVLVSTTARAHAGHGEDLKPPPVPPNIEVPSGNAVFFKGHGVGTQNYICLPSAASFAWSLFTPEATLFSRTARQLTTHFFSPNPLEGGTIRAAWQHSRDTSTVWARLAPDGASTDPNFVAPGAIPWLVLETAGTQEGPGGGDALTVTTFIQRLNTAGGVAPSTGCSQASDVGRKAFVPYEADYFFFADRDREDR